MAQIDERNETNQLLAIHDKIDDLSQDLKLIRFQYIGLGAGLLLIAYGLYKVGSKLPA